MSQQLDRDRPLWQLCIADRARRRPDRRRRQGAPLHGRRDRRGRAGRAAAGPDARAGAVRAGRLAPRPDAGRRSAGSRAACSTSCAATSSLLRLPARALRVAACARSASPRTGLGAARAAVGMLRPAPPVPAAERADLAVPAPRHARGGRCRDLQADQGQLRDDRQRRRARGVAARRAPPLPAARRAARAASRRWCRSTCASPTRTAARATGSRSCSWTCPATSRTRSGGCGRSTARHAERKGDGEPHWVGRGARTRSATSRSRSATRSRT